jgi:predicted glutamine amidotransferase
MCRLYGFRSSVMSRVHQSLVAAENALARQSERHRDGWGLAYYVGRYPHLVRSDKMALADGLFKELSAVLATQTLIAHIRKATVGSVGILNCHPFQHGPWSFAHNGELEGFGKRDDVRARVLGLIDPRLRHHVLGTTDSEACFYVFLTQLWRRVPDLQAADLPLEHALAALADTIAELCAIADPGAEQPSRLTFMLTNGSLLVGYRHGRELYFSTHKSRCPERDTCPAYVPGRCESEVKNDVVNHLIVTSEQIASNPNVWRQLDEGEYVAVDHRMVFGGGRLSAHRTELPRVA